MEQLQSNEIRDFTRPPPRPSQQKPTSEARKLEPIPKIQTTNSKHFAMLKYCDMAKRLEFDLCHLGFVSDFGLRMSVFATMILTCRRFTLANTLHP